MSLLLPKASSALEIRKKVKKGLDKPLPLWYNKFIKGKELKIYEGYWNYSQS